MKIQNLFIFLFIILFSPQSFCFAKDKKQNDTIPFIIYKPSYQTPIVKLQNDGAETGNMLTNNSTSKINKQAEKMFVQVNVPKSEINKSISRLQATICSIIQNGSVKVWLSTNIEGKGLFITAATHSGIEITFNCSK